MTNRARTLALLITLLALVALGISAYLSWVSFAQSSVVGCGGESGVDCDEVLTSSWSKWLGIPVSLLAVATYVGILALVWPVAAGKRGWMGTVLFALVLMAAGAAVWFTSTQAILLGHFCIYCCAAHLCGLLVAVATFFLLQSPASGDHLEHMSALFGASNSMEPEDGEPYHPLVSAGLASAGLAALIAGQFFLVPSGMTFEEIAAAPDSASTFEETTTKPVEPPLAEEDLPTVSEDPLHEPESSNQTEPASIGTADEENFDFPIDEDAAPVAEESGGTDLLEESDEFIFEENSQEQTAQGEPEVPADDADRSGRRLVRYGAFPQPIDVAAQPLIGPADADQVLVEMLDYTCPHCRHMHKFIMAARGRYGDQLAVAVMHVPLSKDCNPEVKREQSLHYKACDYARFAIGVWQLDPAKFVDYHDFLMQGEKAPGFAAARREALKMVGNDLILNKNLKSDANRRIADHINKVTSLRAGLPIIVTTKGVLRGIPKSEAEWFKFCEETLGLKPVSK